MKNKTPVSREAIEARVQASIRCAQELQQPREANLRELYKRLRAYEKKYRMTSDAVREEIASGRLEETFEICSWLIAYDLWQRLKDAA